MMGQVQPYNDKDLCSGWLNTIEEKHTVKAA